MSKELGLVFVFTKVDLRGFDKAITNIPKRGNKFLSEVAKEMTKEMQDGFQNLGGARSQPGEFPANQTRRLRDSLKATKEGNLHYEISDGPADGDRLYGFNLEMGVGVAARPFMIPIFTKWQNGKFLATAKDFDWIK